MTSTEDINVRRWGGLAGIAGGLLLIVVFAIVAIFAGPEPAEPAGPISRFPDIRVARTVENGLYLAVLMLWIPLTLGLHRRLGTAPALFGSALNLFGLGILAAGAIPHFVTAGLSTQYHSSGVTAAEQQILVLQWHSALDMFEALLYTGLLIMPVGMILLGWAMRAFSRTSAAVSIALGIAGLACAIVVLIEPGSTAAVGAVFALLGFHTFAGWKLLRSAG